MVLSCLHRKRHGIINRKNTAAQHKQRLGRISRNDISVFRIVLQEAHTVNAITSEIGSVSIINEGMGRFCRRGVLRSQLLLPGLQQRHLSGFQLRNRGGGLRLPAVRETSSEPHRGAMLSV